MIALPDNLPLVCHERRYTAPFRPEWVRNSLCAAARAAGYDSWWVAGHVAEGVHAYLGQYHTGTVISTREVETAMRLILEGIGYEEVAAAVRLTPPPVEVPLPDLAERAGDAYELGFFRILDEELVRLRETGVRNLRFSGLRYAVKVLGDARRWGKGCAALREEILVFLSSRLAVGRGESIAFTAS